MIVFIQRFAKYHMLPKPLYTSAMDNGRYVTVEGHFVDIKTGGEEEVTVNDATVTDADISGSNGVLHVIDKVLMPVSGTLMTQNIHRWVGGKTGLSCSKIANPVLVTAVVTLKKVICGVCS